MSETTHTWKVVQPPKKKKEWRYKHLRLLVLPPEQNLKGSGKARKRLPLEPGAIVKILMRRNAKETWAMCTTPNVSEWGDMRVLELEWYCPFCGSAHRFFIPEEWVAAGFVKFVEEEA